MEQAPKQLKKAIEKLRSKNPNIDLRFGGVPEVEYIPTPFPTLNNLGGGMAKGKFGTIAGASQTAKSTLLAQIIAHAQQEDPEFIAL